MQVIDFRTLGVKPKGELLRQASKVLSDLFAFGDFNLRSAWLYYGSIASAAKAFKIPLVDYQMAVTGQSQINPTHLLKRIPELDWYRINFGSYMIMEMSPVERAELFPDRYPLPLTRDGYIKRIESWTRTQVERWGADADKGWFPVETAKMLLKHYVLCQEVLFRSYGVNTEGSQARRLVCNFMNNCLYRWVQPAIKFRNRIEDAAVISELYAVALGIIREYETYCSQRAKADRHIKVQERIVESNYHEFFVALEERDGSVCKGCGSLERLVIDHCRPLSIGGFSALENLQLLCSACNGTKGDRTMDYLYRRINRSRKQSLENAPNQGIHLRDCQIKS